MQALTHLIRLLFSARKLPKCCSLPPPSFCCITRCCQADAPSNRLLSRVIIGIVFESSFARARCTWHFSTRYRCVPSLAFSWSMSAVSSSALNLQGQGTRQSTRQTRTNPSRVSKTVGRSSFGFGRGSTAEVAPTPPVPHGFYPAITHFTDAITALPREFRRHNSLLKEVDAKAWALEENLLQLLQSSLESQPVPHPPHPAPIVGGVIREDVLPKVSDMRRVKNIVGFLCPNELLVHRNLPRRPNRPRVKTVGFSSIAFVKTFPIL